MEHHPSMTCSGGHNGSNSDNAVSLAQSLPPKNNEDHFATAPTVATPGKPSATTVTKIAAVVAAGLVTLLVIWLTRR